MRRAEGGLCEEPDSKGDKIVDEDRSMVVESPVCPSCQGCTTDSWKKVWWGLSRRVKCPLCGYKWNPKDEKCRRKYAVLHFDDLTAREMPS